MKGSQTAAVLLACLLTVSLVPGPAVTGLAGAQDDSDGADACQTEVAHDAFLDDDSVIAEFNDTGSAESVAHNTRVTIEETGSFYRVQAENPNSYCVHTTVSVSPEILPPTTLGNVSSNNDVTTATWEDVLNFDRQTAHTEITFVIPGNSTVLFAPSKPTVLIPAWRDEKKHDAQSVISTVTSYFSDEQDLDKRTYTFTADDSPSVTIPLQNDDRENQTIDEWNAVYRTSESEPWAPVDQESDAPVFYQDIGDGEKVRFYFNDKSAEVQFTANPTLRDKGRWEVRSFWRSVNDLGDLLPFTTAPGTEVIPT